MRLKKIMNDRGLRQVDILEKSKPFQDKLGIKMSKTHLSNYINGKSNPDQQKLILLSQTLGVSEPWLMGYDVPMIEPRESENDSETIEETITVMKKLEEPRQKIVLDTANVQLKEQEEQKSKIVSIKNEQEKFDLADLVDDNKVDWDKWVSFDGRPLTDEVKEAMKKALGKELEDK
ncbi:putative cI-like repressor [Lactococcus phage ul36.k1]|uniref:CI-like repressor n=1 Tax=Lactococcus phage ul36 TaxID=114416 RepID=UPI0000EA236F|nr:CI-like repressor [Lactococcus phage ul36]ABD63640.1 putative cI-like repressor [Lactococcus phage ul36.k1]ABD63700.1 putative cI repressor [Lactococcus phage ul36.k1t1]ABD63751.1 putative cI-like repressor [Lactococcus phage ul36.t1]ABD63803.1 putative cI-like repressor [Lactococcus phage ul36.t1k1]AAM75753.2 putative cI-like repressor [Lactococcus phage ul36]